MKLTIIIYSIFVLTSCNASKKSMESNNITSNKIETSDIKLETEKSQESPIAIYESHTRGYHFTLTVYETYATTVKEYNGIAQRLDVNPEDITDLRVIISKLSLKEISTYEAPTKKRHYDGAPHTSISVFKDNEKFSSQTFDGGFPPKALEVLVNKVLSLSPEK
jgi:hypothetical protein